MDALGLAALIVRTTETWGDNLRVSIQGSFLVIFSPVSGSVFCRVNIPSSPVELHE